MGSHPRLHFKMVISKSLIVVFEDREAKAASSIPGGRVCREELGEVDQVHVSTIYRILKKRDR